MQPASSTSPNRYYTNDHEWVDFRGNIAYTGICKFKLTGFRQIQEISFTEISGLKKQGEVFALIKYNDYVIEAHMPVDGKVVQLNERLVDDNPDLLLEDDENAAWIAMIMPLEPNDRKDLMLPVQYELKGKNKFIIE